MGVKQPQVIVDFGHRGDGGARVAARGALLDGNRRRQSFDVIDLGLLEPVEKLPGVGRKALDIAALSLGIKRIEGERRLAGTGQPGDDHQLVARDFDVDVFEVVLACAPDDDIVEHKRTSRNVSEHYYTTGMLFRQSRV
ncbi:hypothetical protein SDC9_133819 [bioreactor metagenome]|uniref:Uncharacterized protein n=1 Tax=bioreactor metagenome TaxID=1076179 RepID=A0A645DCI4_9ZZZZ